MVWCQFVKDEDDNECNEMNMDIRNDSWQFEISHNCLKKHWVKSIK